MLAASQLLGNSKENFAHASDVEDPLSVTLRSTGLLKPSAGREEEPHTKFCTARLRVAMANHARKIQNVLPELKSPEDRFELVKWLSSGARACDKCTSEALKRAYPGGDFSRPPPPDPMLTPLAIRLTLTPTQTSSAC